VNSTSANGIKRPDGARNDLGRPASRHERAAIPLLSDAGLLTPACPRNKPHANLYCSKGMSP